jgi:hypothetical protein
VMARQGKWWRGKGSGGEAREVELLVCLVAKLGKWCAWYAGWRGKRSCVTGV